MNSKEQTTIEQGDSSPLLIAWMEQMQLATTIDYQYIMSRSHALQRYDNSIGKRCMGMRGRYNVLVDHHGQPHREWEGLSYGQLTVLFLACVLQQREHRLSYFANRLQHHRHGVQSTTGWARSPKEGTNDRLGIVLQTLGSNAKRLHAFHQQHGQHLVHAYALPTDGACYDTTSFNVYHAPPEPGQTDHALLRFGFRKDQRPALLQFKQALGTLDPAGVPLVSPTLHGNGGDDPLYIPAWQEFVRILGHTNFVFVSDAKAACLRIRATIAHGDGHYLFPLPMTGAVPTLLRQWVPCPPTAMRPLHLPTSVDDPTLRDVGKGFRTWRQQETTLDDGTVVRWRESCLDTFSPPQAQQQQEHLQHRLDRAEAVLHKLRPKAGERAAAVLERADAILAQHHVTGLIQVQVRESSGTQRRSGKRGRPAADTPGSEETRWQVTFTVTRQEEARALEERVTGWCIYVTNTRQDRLTHAQALAHYRAQWIAEHGYHRFKHGAIPVLPLFVRVPERIIGLLVILLLAWQVLTLLELVARRSLAERQEEIAGLVPGNPKMQTARPTAERMLEAFGNLHLLVQRVGDQVQTRLVEPLSPVQRYILELLHLSPSCYDLTGAVGMPDGPILSVSES
jgi:transposase